MLVSAGAASMATQPIWEWMAVCVGLPKLRPSGVRRLCYFPIRSFPVKCHIVNTAVCKDCACVQRLIALHCLSN